MLLYVLLAASVAIPIMAALIGTWVVVIRRWSQGLPILAGERDPAAPLGLFDVVLAIMLLIGFSTAATQWVNNRFHVAETPAEALAVSYHVWNLSGLSLASITTLLVSGALIMMRYRVSVAGLGFGLHWLWRDLRLGAAAFLVLAPPIYALQFALVQWRESHHPVVELLKEHPDPTLIAASVVSAVIVAPVFEEYLFRGLLQGWLERLVSYSGDTMFLFLGGGQSNQESGAGAKEMAPPKFSDHKLTQFWLAWLPTVTSAAIFAGMHLAHGPDAIPLFFLALGLGFLYHRTRRLLPCIVVHFLLNACSMSMFLLTLLPDAF